MALTEEQILYDVVEKFGSYLKNISIGQYNENGVNIGWKQPEQVIAEYILSLVIKERKEAESRAVVEEKKKWITVIEKYDKLYENEISVENWDNMVEELKALSQVGERQGDISSSDKTSE